MSQSVQDRSAAPTPSSAGPQPSWPLRRSLGTVTLAWVFGAVWMNSTAGAPFTLFAQSLGANKFQFGLLAALPFVASLVSMPASLLIERTGRRKTFFLHGLYLQRLLWFPIALAPVWAVCRWGPAASGRAMSLLLTLTFLMYAAGAFGSPAWVSWMADLVPDRVRGAYFSRRRQWGILSAVPAALLVGWLLDHQAGAAVAAGPAGSAGLSAPSLATLKWCAIIFMAAAVFGLADIAMFRNLPETPHEPRRGAVLLRALAEPLRNRRFMAFAGFVATLTFAVSFMGQFVTLYLIEKVHVDSFGTQLMLLVAPMLAQLLVLPVWGKAADRMGKKPVLAAAALGLGPVGLGWCLMSEGSPWLGYALSAAGAALWTGVEVANFNLVLEMSDARPDARPGAGPGDGTARQGGGSAYAAVNGVVVNIAGCLGGLSAGFLAQALGDWSWQPLAGGKTFTFYDVLFALSGVLRVAAVVVFLPFVQEPNARQTAEAVRFMCGNLYSNLHGALLQPLRLLTPRRGTPAVAASDPGEQPEGGTGAEGGGIEWAAAAAEGAADPLSRAAA